MRTVVKSLLVLAALVAFAVAASLSGARAQATGFNPADYGKARLPVRQSTGDAATYIDTNKGAFEPIGELNPRDPLALRARPVGRIDIVMRNRSSGEETGATCTGSLVAGDLVLTNHHCLPIDGENEPVKASILMDYLNLEGAGSRRFELDVRPVEASAALDYALTRVEGRPASTYGTVQLRLGRYSDGQSLMVFHHPLGRPKMMSRFRCLGVRNQPQDAEFRHRCDTLGGSSGSLLFTTAGEVVALHKEGGLDPKDPSSFNTATRFSALLQSSEALRSLSGAPGGARPAPAAASRAAPAAQSRERSRLDKEDLSADDMNDTLKGR
jgi:V8-like Glu-specific endopeptidase